jgi:anthranilate/para-aminobenzoate synthase component I
MMLSEKEIVFDQPIAPIQSDEEFASRVRNIQDTEIAGGNICQMILSQPYIGKIRDFSHADVESAYRNALKQR